MGLLLLLLVLVILLSATWLGARIYGAGRWQADTQALNARLAASQQPVRPQWVQLEETSGLPDPVQRFLRKTLQAGRPMVVRVQMRHEGLFNLGQTTDQWRPFTSEQQVLTQQPGFVWNGRVTVLPGLPVWVHDAFLAGEGRLHASLLGLWPLADLQGTEAIAAGQLLRFFAEAAWYPTALLPSQGVTWVAVNDHTALGTLTSGALSASLVFTFNEQNLIEQVYAAARGRTVGNDLVPTPWSGRFWNYTHQGGMFIPLEGEVAWLLPEGVKPYWKGRVTDIVYEFAP
ncbi:MAG: hypothetical protein IGQ88_05985 [Gloeomargaritaceae cyanobacterium C42_A2020_066]|nr:hypothetical protein [Gloeomargaritaceae cyanobacterium C42_A2020_066]